MCQYKIITKSNEETRSLGKCIGSKLKNGMVVLLEGPLGAGKTTFSSGVGLGLGIKRRVNSPTYTIMKQYTGRYKLYHIDAYRISSDESEYLGIEDAIYGDGICLIEWATNIEELLPKSYLKISIEIIDEFSREVVIETVGENYVKFGCDVFEKNVVN